MTEEEKEKIEIIKEKLNRPNEIDFTDYKIDTRVLIHIIKKQELIIEELKPIYKKIQEINYKANKDLSELVETSISKYKMIEDAKELEQDAVLPPIIKQLLEE